MHYIEHFCKNCCSSMMYNNRTHTSNTDKYHPLQSSYWEFQHTEIILDFKKMQTNVLRNAINIILTKHL